MQNTIPTARKASGQLMLFLQVAARALPHVEIFEAKRCSSGSIWPIEDKQEEDIVVRYATRVFRGETA